jgi:hypothetical protein
LNGTPAAATAARYSWCSSSSEIAEIAIWPIWAQLACRSCGALGDGSSGAVLSGAVPSGAVLSALALVEGRGARLEEHRGSCREGLLRSTLALDRS